MQINSPSPNTIFKTEIHILEFKKIVFITYLDS